MNPIHRFNEDPFLFQTRNSAPTISFQAHENLRDTLSSQNGEEHCCLVSIYQTMSFIFRCAIHCLFRLFLFCLPSSSMERQESIESLSSTSTETQESAEERGCSDVSSDVSSELPSSTSTVREEIGGEDSVINREEDEEAVTGSELTLIGDVNQYNAVVRSDLNRPALGSSACPFIAAEAALIWLRGGMNRKEDVDLAILGGMRRIVSSLGTPEFGLSSSRRQVRPNSFEELRSVIEERDRNPAELDRCLNRALAHQDWESISSFFENELEDARDWSRMHELQNLEGQMGGERLAERLVQAINAFANLVPLNTRGASLFTCPPNTYGLFLRKNGRGEISEVAVYESHGSRIIGESSNGAFFRKWTATESLNPVVAAVNLLTRLSPSLPDFPTQFSIEPLRLS